MEPAALQRQSGRHAHRHPGIANLAATRPDPGGPAPLEAGRALVCASVDVGATSVHLLVAGVAGGTIQPIADTSVFLELGRVLRDRAVLGAGPRLQLTEALQAYARAAHGHGATRIAFVGTEPLRRAADAARVIHAVDEACRVPLHVLSHEEEAWLTIVGVMGGRRVARRSLVVDVGGGSSEFCVIDGDRPPQIVGLRLGAGALVDAYVAHDPPTTIERASMREAAVRVLSGAPSVSPAEIVGVGGTASNLRKLAPASADGLLTRDGIAAAVATLVSGTAVAVAARHGLNPVRARVLPGGAAILDAVMERYGADAIRISEAGLREGLVLALAHRDGSWRDALPELAVGWIA